MLCPSCGTEVRDDAWFCPQCAYQLKEDVAAPPLSTMLAVDTQRDATFVEEVSRTIAWAGAPEITAEALIVGEASDTGEAAQVFHGAVAQGDGSTPAYQLYAFASGSGVEDAAAVVQRTSVDPGPDLTPYERFVYDEVDGRRSLGEIQAAGLLAPAEVQVSLLTLAERGLVVVAPPPPPAPLPTLDPSFLVELSSSPGLKPLPRIAAAPSPVVPVDDLTPPPRAASIAPETARARPTAPSPPRSRPSAAPATATVVRARPSEPPPVAAPARRTDISPPGPRDVRLDKARQLFSAAMVDRASGNVVSARMNLKLAVAFDPDNATYHEAFAQLGQAQTVGAEPMISRPAAQKAYDEACAAEARGDVDKAIKLMESALRLGDDPVILNRLGVVLSMRRGDTKRAQTLLSRAVELAPSNPVYTHNLSKVLAQAASREVDRSADGGKPKGSFWKRLLGR